MSALSTRDALAKALHDSTVPVCPHWATGSVCERQADALIASGAVIDAADLADELRAMGVIWGGNAMWVTTGTKVADLMVETITTALTERGEQA